MRVGESRFQSPANESPEEFARRFLAEAPAEVERLVREAWARPPTSAVEAAMLFPHMIQLQAEMRARVDVPPDTGEALAVAVGCGIRGMAAYILANMLSSMASKIAAHGTNATNAAAEVLEEALSVSERGHAAAGSEMARKFGLMQ